MKHFHWFLLSLALTLLAACASPPRPAPAVQDFERQLHAGGRLYQAGQLVEAKAAFQRATSAAELIDDTPRLVDALMATGASELLLGDLTSAERSYRRAQREANTESMSGPAVQASIAVAETARRRGENSEALSLFRAAREQGGLTVDQRGQLENGMALCLMASGDLDAAESVLLPLEPVAGKGSVDLHASTLANLARLRMLQGDLTGAATLAGQALKLDRDRHHPPAIAADHALLGEISQRAGRLEEAQRHVDTANRIFRQTGQPKAQLR